MTETQTPATRCSLSHLIAALGVVVLTAGCTGSPSQALDPNGNGGGNNPPTMSADAGSGSTPADSGKPDVCADPAKHCEDGKTNCAETGLDCGDGCKPCTPPANVIQCDPNDDDCYIVSIWAPAPSETLGIYQFGASPQPAPFSRMTRVDTYRITQPALDRLEKVNVLPGTTLTFYAAAMHLVSLNPNWDIDINAAWESSPSVIQWATGEPLANGTFRQTARVQVVYKGKICATTPVSNGGIGSNLRFPPRCR